MGSSTGRLWPAGLVAGSGLLGLAVALELIRPFTAGSVGFDSAASVIYFDRISAGRHLEAFVTATPKPVLTVIYGALMALSNDWRSVALAAIASYAVAVALAAAVGLRSVGIVGGLAAAVALLTSTPLLTDVAIAYALSWALCFWLLAAVAMTRARPRPLLAGVALGLATLARLETLAIIAVAAAALALAALRARRAGRPIDWRSWQLLVALFAIPVMLVHDVLLTGDPWFWLNVSAEYSRRNPGAVLNPGQLLFALGRIITQHPILSGIGVLGLGWLAVRGRRIALVGLVGMTLGVAAFLLVLSMRGTYVSSRYFGATQIGIGLAAAAGVGGLFEEFRTSWAHRSARLQGHTVDIATVAVGLALIGLVVLATWRPPSLSRGTIAAIRDQNAEARHADRAIAVISCALSATGTRPSSGDPPASAAIVLGPTLLRPRLAHDLGLPLWAVGGLAPASLAPAGRFLPGALIAVHDGRLDGAGGAFGVLEQDAPSEIGGLALTPLVHDQGDQFWIAWISRSSGPLAPTACGAAVS